MTEQLNRVTITARITALDDLAQYNSSDDEFEEYINREITDEITQYTNDDEFEAFINKKLQSEWEEEYGTIPQKATFIVTGAGSTIVNGYYEENGIHNHKPKYRRIDTNGTVVLHNSNPIEMCCGGGWCMGIWLCADKGWVYDMVQSINPSLPPTTGWKVVNNGIAPLPTLTFLHDNIHEKPTTSQKLYHGTINHASTCVDHTFWVYSPYLKLQNKWDTHLPVRTYCNNHIQHDKNTFICLGHTNQADLISAQKEWKKNGWNEELVTAPKEKKEAAASKEKKEVVPKEKKVASENVNTIKPLFRNVRYYTSPYHCVIRKRSNKCTGDIVSQLSPLENIDLDITEKKKSPADPREKKALARKEKKEAEAE